MICARRWDFGLFKSGSLPELVADKTQRPPLYLVKDDCDVLRDRREDEALHKPHHPDHRGVCGPAWNRGIRK